MPLSHFDIVVQVSEPCLQNIFKAMHVSGTFSHIFTGCFEDRFTTVVISSPTVTLTGDLQPDGTIKALASARVLYHSRKASDATDHGRPGAAVVNANVHLHLTNRGDPALLDDCFLDVAWSATHASDLNVHSPLGPVVEYEIRNVLLDLITKNARWQYPIPDVNFDGLSFNTGALRFLKNGQRSAAVLALNQGNALKGSQTELSSVFVSRDWAVGLNSDFLSDKIAKEISEQLGGMPAPRGSHRLVLSDSIICVIPNPLPFGDRCLGNARQQVFLDSLNWTFAEGKISFSGEFSQETNSFLIPKVSAAFQFDVLLSILGDGSISTLFTTPAIQIHEWYANFVNTVTRGEIGRAISAALNTALNYALKSDGIIDVNKIKEFTSIGLAFQLDLGMQVQSLNIHDFGIVIEGSLDAGPTSARPIAAFQVLESASNNATFLFNAQSSWCPGSHPASFHWDFGDGNSLTSAGANETFITYHTYSPGKYRVCLTVTDTLGMSTTTCQEITVGELELSSSAPVSINMNDWFVCAGSESFTFAFFLSSNNQPVENVHVTLASNSLTLSGHSDVDGRVQFLNIPETSFDMAIRKPDLFYKGALRIQYAKPGYSQGTQSIFLKDCAESDKFHRKLAELLDHVKSLPTKAINPLGPIESLAKVKHVGNSLNSVIRDAVLVSEFHAKTIQLLTELSDHSLVKLLLNSEGVSLNAVVDNLKNANSKIHSLFEARVKAIAKDISSKKEFIPTLGAEKELVKSINTFREKRSKRITKNIR